MNDNKNKTAEPPAVAIWRNWDLEPSEGLPIVVFEVGKPVTVRFLSEGEPVQTKFADLAVRFEVETDAGKGVIISSSKRLLWALAKFPRLTGRTLTITAIGNGFERQYEIKDKKQTNID